jgi:H/ACA ribonucleoprotein complex subunit 2
MGKSEKKDKKEKREKRATSEGVSKSSSKDKKEKKVKLANGDGDAADALLKQLEAEKPEKTTTVVVTTKDVDAANGEVKVKVAIPIGALVPFANPLADEKTGKKVLKSVKKGLWSLS